MPNKVPALRGVPLTFDQAKSRVGREVIFNWSPGSDYPAGFEEGSRCRIDGTSVISGDPEWVVIESMDGLTSGVTRAGCLLIPHARKKMAKKKVAFGRAHTMGPTGKPRLSARPTAAGLYWFCSPYTYGWQMVRIAPWGEGDTHMQMLGIWTGEKAENMPEGWIAYEIALGSICPEIMNGGAFAGPLKPGNPQDLTLQSLATMARENDVRAAKIAEQEALDRKRAKELAEAKKQAAIAKAEAEEREAERLRELRKNPPRIKRRFER